MQAAHVRALFILFRFHFFNHSLDPYDCDHFLVPNRVLSRYFDHGLRSLVLAVDKLRGIHPDGLPSQLLDVFEHVALSPEQLLLLVELALAVDVHHLVIHLLPMLSRLSDLLLVLKMLQVII